MQAEYHYLTIMTLLFLFAWFPALAGKAITYGLRWELSNRDSTPNKVLPIWVTRSERAYNNLKDYFPAYVVAILLLGALNKFDDDTSMAALIFVLARIVHFIGYTLGFPLVRGSFFIVGLCANTFLLLKIIY